MKAIVHRHYGPADLLEYGDVQKPDVGPGEVLVRVHAASVNPADWRLMRANPFLVRVMGMGFFAPKRSNLGQDLAGIVEAIGAGVTRFRPGDEVFGGGLGSGSFAEFASVGEHTLSHKPRGLDFGEAASTPLAALTALLAIREVEKNFEGARVLIQGASGGVGTFAVQLAKLRGAHVTAVTSTRNVEFVRSLGADRVIDYTKSDWTDESEDYDVILAIAGYHPIWHYAKRLRPDGTYLCVGGANAQFYESLFFGSILSIALRKKLRILTAEPSFEDHEELRTLLDSGSLRTVIDRVYRLEETPEALRYLEAGHARGKVVVEVLPRAS